MDADIELENPHPLVPLPHEILWFPAGDVILSTDRYLFKVHKDILSFQSSVFKDMFDFPAVKRPQSGRRYTGDPLEVYEGLPVVRLIGDEAEGVVHLLRTVYERQYYCRDDINTPLVVLTSLLELSAKYDFQQIRRDIIVQIMNEYPTSSPDTFDAFNISFAPAFGTERIFCHFPLLKAVFKAKIDALLPLLYYACSGFHYKHILAEADILDAECLHTLILGKAQLLSKTNAIVGRIPDIVRDVVSKCERDCPNVVRITCLEKLLGSASLSHIEGSHAVFLCVKGTCRECDKRIVSKINKQREDLWEEVPSFFGFQGWYHWQILEELSD
ncbi:hypothetical protein SCHPADRAFT_610717 [Schizopora paradoxa]|uniref:BTB domain-containing protein n=1 Tax=Schizopora paradoxa TaxID=27342 RepID=A0A0H2R998_9AGAM|nr:hypothetical protein SCHPADRAFT_610717 [Schizopora paradoxa]